MKKFKNKIFLIGGASSVAKSSLSFELMKKYNIIHKLGTGFVREMAKTFILKKNNKNLYSHSFETNLKNPIDNLYLQSIPLKKMLQKAINRANNEGTSIIIEGVNIIPGLMEFNDVDEKVLLIVKCEKKHLKMLKQNNTHKLRKVEYKFFKNVRRIQEELIVRAKKYNWKILDKS
jgi:2-phosphoglycerate kinase